MSETRWTRRRAALSGLMVVQLSACASHGSARAPSPRATPALATSSSTPDVVLKRVDIDTWVVGQQALPGRVLGTDVVWAGGVDIDHINTVFLRDTTAHRTSVLAHGRPGWGTDWVKGDGHWVVYMEAMDDESDEAATPWRMHVIDLTTRASRLVATSDSAHGGVPPSPQIEGDTLVWVQGSAAGKDLADVLVLDLHERSATPRTLVRGKAVSDCGITGGRIVFAASAGQGTNLFVVPAAGGVPRQVTDSGRVTRANVAEGWVAYEEGPPGGDTQNQFLLPVPTLAAPRHVTGPSSPNEEPESNLTPGRMTIGWFGPSTILVARSTDPKRTLTLTEHPDIQIRMDWEGDTLLWGETTTDRGGLHNTLRVSRFV